MALSNFFLQSEAVFTFTSFISQLEIKLWERLYTVAWFFQDFSLLFPFCTACWVINWFPFARFIPSLNKSFFLVLIFSVLLFSHYLGSFQLFLQWHVCNNDTLQPLFLLSFFHFWHNLEAFSFFSRTSACSSIVSVYFP